MTAGDKEVLVEEVKEVEEEAGVLGRARVWARNNRCLFLVGATVKLAVIVALVYWHMLPYQDQNRSVLVV